MRRIVLLLLDASMAPFRPPDEYFGRPLRMPNRRLPVMGMNCDAPR